MRIMRVFKIKVRSIGYKNRWHKPRGIFSYDLTNILSNFNFDKKTPETSKRKQKQKLKVTARKGVIL